MTFAYGGYDDNYELVADFPRAGQGLANGSEVSYRGVSVGEVRSVELVDRQARVTLAMDPGFEVPVDARVVVRPKTVFGEKFVDLTFPEGVDGPYLSDGDRVENADSATEVEDFFEGSDNLFSAIDENELAELVTSLNESARGTGDDVARAFESSADASALGADTIDAQLRALDSFATFQDAIRSIGPDLNTISANNEIALGEFNANRPGLRAGAVQPAPVRRGPRRPPGRHPARHRHLPRAGGQRRPPPDRQRGPPDRGHRRSRPVRPGLRGRSLPGAPARRQRLRLLQELHLPR